MSGADAPLAQAHEMLEALSNVRYLARGKLYQGFYLPEIDATLCEISNEALEKVTL